MERKERGHHIRERKLEAVRLAAIGYKTKAKVAPRDQLAGGDTRFVSANPQRRPCFAAYS